MINYKEIEKLLLETLDKETPESLRGWLNSKKAEEMLADLGEGDYQTLESERSAFQHSPNKTNTELPVIYAGETNYCLAA